MNNILLITFLFLTFFKGEKDDFHFPKKFYRLNLNHASVDSVTSIFGLDCSIDTIYSPEGPGDWAGTVGQIRIRYESEKLLFTFTSRNYTYPYQKFTRQHGTVMKFKFESIAIEATSSLKFGKPARKISQYSVQNLVSTFGQPDTVCQNESNRFYIFKRAISNRQYSFWLNKAKNEFSWLQISPTD